MNYEFGEFEMDCISIADQANLHNAQYDLILAPLRGGAIPAVRLSHLLHGEPRVFAFEMGRGLLIPEWAIQEIRAAHFNGQRMLLVDDIIDSGESIVNFFDEMGIDDTKIDIACLVWNSTAVFKPKYFGKKINRDVDKEYVTFFWE